MGTITVTHGQGEGAFASGKGGAAKALNAQR
jgi:hypothetical protein